MKKPLKVCCILARFASLLSLELGCSAAAGVTLLVVMLLLEPSLWSGVLLVSVDFLAVLFVLGSGGRLMSAESMGGSRWLYLVDPGVLLLMVDCFVSEFVPSSVT